MLALLALLCLGGPLHADDGQTVAPEEGPPGAIDGASELAAALAADQQAAATATSPEAGTGAPSTVGRFFQSLNPDLSIILDVAGAVFTTDTPLMVGGHDPTRTGFNFQQLELAFSAAVDPYFRFDTNIIFSEFGVEVEEAFGTTLSLPWNLQARAGLFLTRFGRINNTHMHRWDYVDQMLVMGKFFGGEGNRGVGVELSWLLPLPWFVELLGSMTDAAGAATARSFYGPDNLGVRDPGDFQYTGALKQFFPLGEDWSLLWGLSAATGPNPTGRDNVSNVFGTDLHLRFRPITYGSYTLVTLTAEWLLRRRQVPLDVLQDQGMYASLFYRFARRWAVAARYEFVTGLVEDYLDPQWTELRQRVSGNLTFWPTEFSRLRLQYNYDRPEWRDDYHAVFLAIEFVVGAHGAHRF